MVRSTVPRTVEAAFRKPSIRGIAPKHQRGYSRDIRTKCNLHHRGHDPYVFVEGRGHSKRHLRLRRGNGCLLSPLQPAFEFADIIQVTVESRPVTATEFVPEWSNVADDLIEDAFVDRNAGRALFRRAPVAEQPLEHFPGINLVRQWLRGRQPCN